jgi:hypothetical protein
MKTAKENQGAGSVDVDALLAAINEISESEVQRTQTIPTTSVLMAGVTTPGASWRRPLSSIFMISASRKPTAEF